MRISIASTSIAALLALTAGRVAAQEAGDPVTYTNGGVIYTAVLDPDLDTVSDRPYSTIVAGGALGGAGAGAGAGALVTTTDANGNPVTVSNGVTLGVAATTSPIRTTAAVRTTAVAAGGVSDHDEDDTTHNESNVNANPKNDLDDLQSPPKKLQFQQFDRRALHTASPDQPKLLRRQAALGGGGGQITSQTGLQTISGYDPPANTAVPEPTNFSSGSILSASQIPGYTGKENSQGVSGGGVSSDGVKLDVGKFALAGTVGAIVFAML